MSGSEMKKPIPCFGSYDFRNVNTTVERNCARCQFNSDCLKVSPKQVGGDHYDKMKIDPWAVWDTWPLEQRIGAYRSNAVKYLMRMGTKGDALEDAKKARHYINKLVEVLESDQGRIAAELKKVQEELAKETKLQEGIRNAGMGSITGARRSGFWGF